jgi:hypothetical protein
LEGVVCVSVFGLYLIPFGKPAGHREVATKEVDVHGRWKPERGRDEDRA